MRISQLRDPITIQPITRTPDGQGGFERSFGTGSDLMANVRDLYQIEAQIAAQVDSGAIKVCTIRYSDATVTPSDRVVFGGVNYRIAGAISNVDGRSRFLQFQLRQESE